MAYSVTCNPWSSQYTIGVGTDTPVAFGAGSLGVQVGAQLSLQNVIGVQASYQTNIYYDGSVWKSITNASAYASAVRLQNGYIDFHTATVSTSGQTMSNWDTTDKKMSILPSGNIGIGTASPATRLQIKGTNQYHQISACFFSTYNAGFSFSDDLAGITYDAGTNSLCLYSDYTGYGKVVISTCGVPRLTATVNGNVGIGTSSPSNKLTIENKVDRAYTPNSFNDNLHALYINFCNQNQRAGLIRFTSHGNLENTFGVVQVGCAAAGCGQGDFVFQAYREAGGVAYNELMRLTNTGNVGISTSTPSYKLHVNGTSYAAGSSQDYKQSICNYNTDSCMFMKLKPVTYQYKEEYCHLGKELKSGTQIGLIAEEVAESHPELAILVNEEDEKVVRNVDYEKLTIILLSELQKLRQEVDQLKNK